LAHTKKLQNAKIRTWQMPPESSGSGPINGRIWSYPAGFGRFGQIRPDQWPDPNRFGQIRQDPDRFRPDPAGLAGIWQYSGRNMVAEVTDFQRWQDTDDQMLSDSGTDWIPTINNC
jgi:hypothetical protein